MILNKRQIRQLKGLAQTCKIKYQLGKNEISDTLLDLLDKGIEKHELIKVDVMQSVTTSKDELASTIANAINAEIVTIIGGVIVLYRKNLKHPTIKLVD